MATETPVGSPESLAPAAVAAPGQPSDVPQSSTASGETTPRETIAPNKNSPVARGEDGPPLETIAQANALSTSRSEVQSEILRHHQHAEAFRQRFPQQSLRIDRVLKMAAGFKSMLLGQDENETLSEEDQILASIIEQGLLDLRDSVKDIHMGRLKSATIALRCFLEQAFFALYYGEQRLDLALWQRSSAHFVMLHQLYSRDHVFCKYFGGIFKERRDPEWQKLKAPGAFSKKIFETLEDLYAALSASVHGRFGQREKDPSSLSTDEVDIYCVRMHAAVTIATEFYEVAGTGESVTIPEEFRFTQHLRVR